MKKIRLIHWKPAEAEELVKVLRAVSFEVDYEAFSNKVMQADRQSSPDAIVIDLTRLPSHGRDLGIAYRTYKATRLTPIVFVGGDPKKASKVNSDLTQNIVRQTGLDSGLVDFKICSVDETWSGLRFTQRKPWPMLKSNFPRLKYT